DVARFLMRGGVGPFDLFARREIGGDTATVVAVARLEDDGETQFLGGAPGILDVAHGSAFWNRNAYRAKQEARQLLVLGDCLGNGAGGVRLCSADTALPGGVPEDNERGAAETAKGDVPCLGGADDGGCARAEPDVVAQLTQLGKTGSAVKGRAGKA